MKDLLDYGTAIERLRERKGLSREDLARGSGVSYSYLSEVERGLKRPSADVLARLATALDMLPSELLRQIEEMSAKGRGLLRKRVFEAPMHEHPGEVPEAAFSDRILGPADRAELAMEGLPAEPKHVRGNLVNELARAASALDPEDVKMLIALARRLAAAKGRNP